MGGKAWDTSTQGVVGVGSSLPGQGGGDLAPVLISVHCCDVMLEKSDLKDRFGLGHGF